MNNPDEIIHINPFEVSFLIHRDRDPAKFRQVKESIRQLGVQQPLHVRDITDWPAKDRRRPDGGLYKWQALFGEGRTTAMKELHESTGDDRFLKLPALVKDIPEAEIVGRFLAENILRRDLPWLDQAKLIRAEVDEQMRTHPNKKAPQFVREIAKEFFITESHASKLLRILANASPRIDSFLKGLTVADAEELTQLPARSQEVVIETLKEEGLDRSNLAAVVRQAKRVAQESGDLSKTALRASLKRLDEDLSRQREKLKLARLHWSLGGDNLRMLLSDKKFRSAVDRHGISYSKFLEAAGDL